MALVGLGLSIYGSSVLTNSGSSRLEVAMWTTYGSARDALDDQDAYNSSCIVHIETFPAASSTW
jgi:hypothetical protein